MFVVNDDLSIYATRGDIVCLNVSAVDDRSGEPYEFQPGDIVRMKVFVKKDAESVVLQKDFPVVAKTYAVGVFLTEQDTKIGEVISKPTDYWYEIELNPYTNPQTIVGYDEDGAKIFKLFPEGRDLQDEEEIVPEDIPIVDTDLSLISSRPVENKAIARAVTLLKNDLEASEARLTAKIKANKSEVNERSEGIAESVAALSSEVAVERARVDNLIASPAADDAELIDIRVGADGKTYESAGTAVREQIKPIASQVKAKNLIDFKKLIRGYIANDGLLNNYSNAFVRSHEVTTDFILVDTTKDYYFAHKFAPVSVDIKDAIAVSQANWFCISLYDASKAFIKRISYDAMSSVVSGDALEGATYVRVSYRTYMFNKPIFAACGVPCEAMDEITTADNLLETYPMVYNGYVTNLSGAIIGTTHDSNGYIPSEQNELTSDFIPCDGGEEMFIFSTAKHDNWIRIAFYGADGNFVSSISYSTTSEDNVGTADYNNFLEKFVVPENAVALRISCRGAFIEECVLAVNDDQRRYLYKECERKYNSKYESEKIALLQYHSSSVKAVAHRGFSGGAPENTLPAYKLAKNRGFDCAECDVSFTSDGVAVLLHDNTIDRTSNGSGSVSSMTLEELRSYDFGAWFGEEYSGTTIPTLSEFLVLCRNIGLKPYIELKAGTEAQVKSLVDVAKRCGVLNDTTWISFHVGYLEFIKNVCDKARLGFVVTDVTDDVIATAQALRTGKNEVFIDSSSYTDDAVNRCVKADIPLEVWTVNAESTVLNLPAYVTGVTSDSLCVGKVLFDNSMN